MAGRCNYLKVIFIAVMIFLGVLAAEARQPNIIFILVDDLGKEWINCYGGEGIETPRIDELAKSGMKFTNAYSMPQCTPSRACFMTGQYPYRSGWVNHWDVPRWGVGYYDWKKNPSVARIMKSAGYKTAVAGKWQINDFRLEPEAMVKHGFDEYCMWTGAEGGVKGSGNRYWDPYIHTKDGSKIYEGVFGPDIYNQFLLDFITTNKDNPFFIYYPMALTHSPLVHTPHEMDMEGKINKHKAMIRYMDFLVGKMYDHLEKLGIRDNTIFIWTTDNGTSGSISNNRDGRNVKGGKAKTTENGVNAPFVVSCPGTVPAGAVCDELVDFTDILQTFADFADAKLPTEHTFDGFSMKDLFTGKSKTSPRKWIMAMGGGSGTTSVKGVENKYYWRDRVIREKRFKLFMAPDKTVAKLVDVQADPDEQNDLSGNPEYAEVVARLKKVADSFPQADNDPIYEQRAVNDWDKTSDRPSQIHKVGHPDNAGFSKKDMKQRDGNGEKKEAKKEKKTKKKAPEQTSMPQTVSEGAIVLEAKTAVVTGKKLHYNADGRDNLAAWSDGADFATWNLSGVKPGTYNVEMLYGASAGNAFTVEANGTVAIESTTTDTGGVKTYKPVPLGKIQLDGGDTAISLKSKGKPKSSLMNFKSMTLTPVE